MSLLEESETHRNHRAYGGIEPGTAKLNGRAKMFGRCVNANQVILSRNRESLLP